MGRITKTHSYSHICLLQKGKGPIATAQFPQALPSGLWWPFGTQAFVGPPFIYTQIQAWKVSYCFLLRGTILGNIASERQSLGWKFSDNTDMTLEHEMLKQKSVHEV